MFYKDHVSLARNFRTGLQEFDVHENWNILIGCEDHYVQIQNKLTQIMVSANLHDSNCMK